MWPVLLGAIVGGLFTLLGGVVGQVRRDRRVRLGAAQLLIDEMFLNNYAIQDYLEVFGRDPTDTDAVEAAGRDMVAHCSTAIWQRHGAELVLLFPPGFRRAIVSTYAALMRNENVPGHHHATLDSVDILEEGQRQLEPHARVTWLDRHIWRF